MAVDREEPQMTAPKTSDTPARCHVCGAPLDSARLGGLCPACTWSALSNDNLNGDGDESPIVDGSLLRIPGHVVSKEIARGGMGIVYLAEQIEPRRTVALKMLLPHQLGSEEMRERFRLEIRTIAALDHPSILPVYQVGEHERLPWFTMKFAARGTLSERRQDFAGKWRAIAELLATLADAVQFAHERGILHRDLKPGNILFDDAGHSYVSDFGLAKLVSAETDLTRSLAVLGTPHYVAPEIAAGSAQQATISSDIYSLGGILYELLAGRTPFEADNVPALLRKITDTEARPLEKTLKVPRDLEIICFKCLAKDPTRRYSSARELALDLRRWLDGRTILARAPGRFELVRAWATRNPALAVASAVITILLLSVIAREIYSARRLREALSESLLAQARMRRGTGRAGQRFETLALVKGAARYRGSGADKKAGPPLSALRTEAAGALALPDLRRIAKWPVEITHYENEFDFTADLSSYLKGRQKGGLALARVADQKILWESPGSETNAAMEMRVSPGGEWAAARFFDGRIELHSIKSNRLVREWHPPPGKQPAFTFAPAGKRFALVSEKSEDIETLDLTQNRKVTLPSDGSSATALAFDFNGDLLAAAGRALTVWRISNGEKAWAAPISHKASALAWSPEGKKLAVALDRRLRNTTSRDDLASDPILVYDAATGEQVHLFSEEAARVERLAFHPDGQSLAAASWSGELVWGGLGPNGFRFRTDGAQRALTFSTDGRQLAYAPTREELGLLEVTKSSSFSEWKTGAQPAEESFTISVSTDGNWVATGASTGIHLWDAARREELASLKLPAPAWYVEVLFGPEGSFLYYSALSFGVRRVELIKSNRIDRSVELRFGAETSLGPPQDVVATSYAADHQSLVVGYNQRVSPNGLTFPTMWLWENGDPERRRKLAENFPFVGYRAVTGGKWGISTDLVEPDLSIWDFQTGQKVRSLGIPLPVSSELSSNGRWIVTRTREEYAVWEVGSWQKISHWPILPDEQIAAPLIASPDSRWFVTATTNGRLILRYLPSGQELMTLSPPHAMQLASWNFSPDSNRLFVMQKNGEVCEWNLTEMGRELADLRLDWQ